MIRIEQTVKAFGVDLPGAYLDISFKYRRGTITADVASYASKEVMSETNEFKLPGIPRRLRLDYDRSRDGVDMMMFVVRELERIITTDEMTKEKYVDTDGKVKERDVIKKAKFADKSKVKIDINGDQKK